MKILGDGSANHYDRRLNDAGADTPLRGRWEEALQLGIGEGNLSLAESVYVDGEPNGLRLPARETCGVKPAY